MPIPYTDICGSIPILIPSMFEKYQYWVLFYIYAKIQLIIDKKNTIDKGAQNVCFCWWSCFVWQACFLCYCLPRCVVGVEVESLFFAVFSDVKTIKINWPL